MTDTVNRVRSWRFTRKLLVKLIFVPFTAAAIFISVYMRTSPYESEDAVRHLFAAGGCGAAQAVGLAPARAGELGYHAKNDANHNGIACEAYLTVSDRPPGRYRGGAKFVRP